MTQSASSLRSGHISQPPSSSEKNKKRAPLESQDEAAATSAGSAVSKAANVVRCVFYEAAIRVASKRRQLAAFTKIEDYPWHLKL